MGQLNRITQQNASSAEELTATSQEMSGQAQRLQQLIAFFKLAGMAQPITAQTDDAPGHPVALQLRPRTVAGQSRKASWSLTQSQRPSHWAAASSGKDQ